MNSYNQSLKYQNILHVPENGEHAYTVPASKLHQLDFDPFQTVTDPTTQKEEIGFYIQFEQTRQVMIYAAEGLCDDHWIDWWIFRSPDQQCELAIINDHAVLSRDDKFGKLIDLDCLNDD